MNKKVGIISETNQQEPDVKSQAGKLLNLIAGYVGFRTIEIGSKSGIFDELIKHHNGISTKQLAAAVNLDPSYVEVWCRSAYGAEVLDVDKNGAYRLSPQMKTLLLDKDWNHAIVRLSFSRNDR